MSKTDSKAAKDMTETMEKTMQRLEGRFQAISEQSSALIGSDAFEAVNDPDEMGMRIDDLEKNVAHLMTQAGMDEQPISK